MNTQSAGADEQLRHEILDLFAQEARIERGRLALDVQAQELGVSSLDLTLAVFAIEDRFNIDLPELQPDAAWPTVGELVQQVLDRIRLRGPAPSPG